MDDKLYYEKRNITAVAEVKETYDYVVKNNYKYYRAVTEKGAIFGWVDERHTKATEGQEWFENTFYKEIPELSVNDNVETINKAVEIKEMPKKRNYAILYEEKRVELEQYKIHYMAIEAELKAIKNAFTVIVNEIKKAMQDD